MSQQATIVQGGRGHVVSFDDSATKDEIETAVLRAYPGAVIFEIKSVEGAPVEAVTEEQAADVKAAVSQTLGVA